MQVLKYCDNKKGVTLIELLASLVLLSIIIISFLSFFSQSMMFSVKVEDKLTAINLAEKVLYEVKSGLYSDSQHDVNGKIYYSNVTEITEQIHLGLTPVRIEIFDESDKLLTEIYGYKE